MNEKKRCMHDNSIRDLATDHDFFFFGDVFLAKDITILVVQKNEHALSNSRKCCVYLNCRMSHLAKSCMVSMSYKDMMMSIRHSIYFREQENKSAVLE